MVRSESQSTVAIVRDRVVVDPHRHRPAQAAEVHHAAARCTAFDPDRRILLEQALKDRIETSVESQLEIALSLRTLSEIPVCLTGGSVVIEPDS